MERRITVAACAFALVVTGAPNAAAKSLPAKYRDLRHEVVQKHGKRAPGRNIIRYGVRTKHGVRHARNADIADSIRTFRSMLAPPAPIATTRAVTPSPGLQSQAPAPAAPTAAPAAAPSSNSVAQCESGGNYSTNTGNGYYGAYQFDDQTWHAAGGSGHASDAPPAEQDARFHSWYAGHPGAWPVCGR